MTDPDAPDPDFVDPLSPTLGFQLRRAALAFTAALETAVKPFGLRPSEASLLRLIAANPGVTQSAIARMLPARPANLVPLIARLEAIGALERTPGRGRAIGLSLSATGAALEARATAAVVAEEARIVGPIGEDERAAAMALLRRIARDACRPG